MGTKTTVKDFPCTLIEQFCLNKYRNFSWPFQTAFRTDLDAALVALVEGAGDKGPPPLGLVGKSDSLTRRGLPLRFSVVEPLSLFAFNFFLLLPACGLLGGRMATTVVLAPAEKADQILNSCLQCKLEIGRSVPICGKRRT